MQAVQHRDSAVVVSLPFRASSVRSARARITVDLALARMPKTTVDDAQVVLSELIGNSVRHAVPLSSGQLLASWWLEQDAVVVAVTDGGSSTAPRVVHHDEEAVGGRGMTIVESLARRWWIQRGTDTVTVTAEIAVC